MHLIKLKIYLEPRASLENFFFSSVLKYLEVFYNLIITNLKNI